MLNGLGSLKNISDILAANNAPDDYIKHCLLQRSNEVINSKYYQVSTGYALDYSLHGIGQDINATAKIFDVTATGFTTIADGLSGKYVLRNTEINRQLSIIRWRCYVIRS